MDQKHRNQKNIGDKESNMKRENINKVNYIINEIERLELIQDFLKNNGRDTNYGNSPYSVRFTDKLTYTFPNDLAFSMFDNILKTSIESDLEKLNKQLEDL